jgi:type I restriction enzyme S subunit
LSPGPTARGPAATGTIQIKTDEGLQQLIKICPGSAGRNRVLSIKRIPEVLISLPPLAEQRRIVARIEELTAQINEARVLRQQAAEEAEVLPRKAADKLLHSDLAQRKPLRDLLSEPLRNGLSVPASGLGSGVCFAKVGVVNSGVFNVEEIKLVNVELAPDSPYWLRKGDMVVSRGNSPEYVGRAAVYEGAPAKCAMPDLLIRVRLDPNKADTRFVSAFFQTSEARDYIAAQISGTSSTMPKISQPKLEALPVPVPTLAEQRRIVTELDALKSEVDALKRLQSETAAELESLLPAILDRAFKGDL